LCLSLFAWLSQTSQGLDVKADTSEGCIGQQADLFNDVDARLALASVDQRLVLLPRQTAASVTNHVSVADHHEGYGSILQFKEGDQLQEECCMRSFAAYF
jgi:hypothetical protein